MKFTLGILILYVVCVLLGSYTYKYIFKDESWKKTIIIFASAFFILGAFIGIVYIVYEYFLH